jgi:hypothetical protein
VEPIRDAPTRPQLDPDPTQLRAKHEAQGGLCFYCEQPAWLPPRDRSDLSNHRAKTRATREHLIHKCVGGTDHDSNIVMACAACNHERGDSPVATWKSYVLARASICT